MLKEELATSLPHRLHSQYAGEGLFQIQDVIDSAYTKMYNRHPMSFARGGRYTNRAALEELKRAEKRLCCRVGVPNPTRRVRSYVISKRASRMGFDWETVDGIYENRGRDTGVAGAEKLADQALLEEEVGDLLFTVAKLAASQHRPEGIEATLDKFVRRFAYVEKI